MRNFLAAMCGLLLLCGMAEAQSVGSGALTASGATCATSGACVSVHFDNPDPGSAAVQLSGTFTATVQFEASNDGGASFVAINGTPLNSTTGASSATTANVWQFNMAGITDLRARCSAYTSGTVVVVIRSSKASAKAGSGGGTSLPALSDSGTVITSTEPIRVPTGALNFSFTGDTTSGLLSSAGSLFVTSGTADVAIKTAGNNAFKFRNVSASEAHFAFTLSKGQHIETQAANNDLAGTCTAAAATTCVVTFTKAYTSAPACTATDNTNIIALKTTMTTSALTITTSASSSDTFSYSCTGNPN